MKLDRRIYEAPSGGEQPTLPLVVRCFCLGGYRSCGAGLLWHAKALLNRGHATVALLEALDTTVSLSGGRRPHMGDPCHDGD